LHPVGFPTEQLLAAILFVTLSNSSSPGLLQYPDL